MGVATLVTRLAARDLRRRRAETALLLLAIVAAMTTLTIGLSVRGVVSDPYQSTREATSGPDVVAVISPPDPEIADGAADQPVDVAALAALIEADGVVDHSGPFPVVGAELTAADRTVDVQVIGRDTAPASVDQPQVTDGSWVREGGAVVEAAFAAAHDLHVGDHVAVNGRPVEIVGLAITAASAPYPETTCIFACASGASPEELAELDLPSWVLIDPGLVWMVGGEAEELAADAASTAYILNLRLDDPASADAFVADHEPTGPNSPAPTSWQELLDQTAELARDPQMLFLLGSGLLIAMAAATVAVLVGGRMADQSRRVGLLKAVGSTPRLVAAVLLAEYAVVALVGAALGLVLGWFIAPRLVEPSAGLVGTSAPAPSASVAVLVAGVAITVAALATFVPALRAARSSTVVALTDTARAPRRTAWLVAISARLPVTLLLGTRMLARRPRRTVLNALGIAVTTSGLVAALAAKAALQDQIAVGGVRATSAERLWPILVAIMVTLVALAAVNAVFIAAATVVDTREAAAVARALGATPQQVSSGLAVAQIVPAVVGAILGLPGGYAVIAALDDSTPVLPPLGELAAVAVATVALIALLTALPARAGGRRPVAEILRSEHA